MKKKLEKSGNSSRPKNERMYRGPNYPMRFVYLFYFLCYVPASRITTAVFLPPPPEDFISSPLYPFCLYEVEMASATHFCPKHFLHLVTKNRKRDN